MSIDTTRLENIAFTEEGQAQPEEQTVQDALEGQEDLYQIVQAQAREIEALKGKLEAMQKDMDSLANNQLNQLRLIADLRKREPGETETSRAEKIGRYLQSRPDQRATFETLKGYLGIDKHRLREAIRTLMKSSPGRYGISRTPGDKRKLILVMLPR